MKRALILCLVGVGALNLAGCDQRTASAPVTPKPGPPPVVKVPPVLTRPYEEGYAAGFVVGKTAGKPRANLPLEEAIDLRSVEAAGAHEDRGLKWPRGWAAGYMDGFRQVSEGRK